MSKEEEIKQNIKATIRQFANGNLSENALNLFQTLGYNTERRSPLDKPTFAAFKEYFIGNQSKFNEEKAMVCDWKYVDLLFQLSKEEIVKQMSPFDTKQVDRTIIETYLFFTIELAKEHYSRTALSHITREVNRLFPMPVMILFKYGSLLTLSVINRRLHKRDDSKDVLEKVTLIKDIRISPAGGGVRRTGVENGVVTHRAHIEILFDLSFDELKNKRGFTNFVEMHNAWQKTLDTKELNKRFYEKLFYWYLWAVKKVRFPQIRPKEDLIHDEAHQSESVIRLLTRLLFCWFMKEKQELIPELLFDKKEVKKILIDFSPENEKSSVFYRAILQNLFFATLSVPIKNRKYIRESFQGKNQDYGNQYVYRYQSEFADAKENLKLFKDIPFLNGGLFECLDKVPENDDEREIRLDGFSSKEEKQAFVPDYLFWDEHKGIDLSKELDNPRKNNETVHGIIDILNSYKFTIEENTPLEEEIALDPELLGKVFESLLAYYNPETKANARKQTGSFYTPREIVNYMVDESLIAALQQKLSDAGITEHVELRLRNLISYNKTENPFTEMETNDIIQALENLKVLDPACGSGAFPMGMLHKLVWILRKVDPENKIWFESIIKHLPTYAQPEMRKKLEGENWDYLRKLGVVQQSVYGVDIQPIAIQIAKLRFFISLLVDQDIKGNEENNFGLLPLPNLDFKLVSANTLIGAPEQNHQNYSRLFFVQDEFFDTFNSLTGQYFRTSKPTEKKKLSEKIENLVSGKVQEKVDEIQRLSTHADERFSKHVAEKNKVLIEQKKNDAKLWKSYNNLFKHESVGFFEIKYFFPEAKEGFDVVIGNPPYIRAEDLGDLKTYLKAAYTVFAPGGDIFSYFYERSFNILTNQGVFCFINNAFDKTTAGKTLREYVSDNFSLNKYVDFKSVGVFEGTTTYPIILLATKSKPQETFAYLKVTEDLFSSFNSGGAIAYTFLPRSALKQPSWSFDHQGHAELLGKISIHKKLRDVFGKCYYGIKTSLNDAFIIEKNLGNSKYLKPVFEGKDIKKWLTPAIGKKMIVFENKSTRACFSGQDEAKAFEAMQTAFPAIMNHLKPFAAAARKRYDQGEYWWELRNCAYYNLFAKSKIIFPNLQNSNKFAYDISGTYLNAPAVFLPTDAKWLLGVLNSKVVWYFLKVICVVRSGGFIEVKPQYFEQIPIPPIKDTDKKNLDSFVNQIINAKKKDPRTDTLALEKQIDVMVYKLYGLTYEEVKIIEPEFAISEVGYEAFDVK